MTPTIEHWNPGILTEREKLEIALGILGIAEVIGEGCICHCTHVNGIFTDERPFTILGLEMLTYYIKRSHKFKKVKIDGIIY